MLFQVARLPPQPRPLKTQCLAIEKLAGSKTKSRCGTPVPRTGSYPDMFGGNAQAIGMLKIDIPEWRSP
jgi:hypothetical protein